MGLLFGPGQGFWQSTCRSLDPVLTNMALTCGLGFPWGCGAGNRDRDHAVLVLAKALSEGRKATFALAAELEAALHFKHRAGPPAGVAGGSGGGAAGPAERPASLSYLRELKLLWQTLSPQVGGAAAFFARAACAVMCARARNCALRSEAGSLGAGKAGQESS